MFYKLLKGKYSPILSHFDEYTQLRVVSLQQSHNQKKVHRNLYSDTPYYS